MRVFIFENDASHAEHLIKLLGGFADGKNELVLNPPISRFSCGAENFDDAVFLVDTRFKIPGGNFLTLARRIRENSGMCHICFMSPSPGDIGFCYKKLVRPSAFLLKPVDGGELRSLLSDIDNFERTYRMQPDDLQILLKTRGIRKVVWASNVIYFTSYDKKVLCYTESEEKIAFYDSLGSIENLYRRFFLRCHSGFLVNRKRIVGFSKKRMVLSLSGISGEVLEIPVSKSRCREVEMYVESTMPFAIS